MPGTLANRQSTQALRVAFRRPAGALRARPLPARVEVLPERGKPLRQAARIAIKDKGRIVFISPADVLAVVAQGNYVVLQRESGSYCLRAKISTVAEKLVPYGFIQIHRSALVSRCWVEELRSDSTGECVLRLRGGREFSVTSTYRHNIRLLAELWLAGEGPEGMESGDPAEKMGGGRKLHPSA